MQIQVLTPELQKCGVLSRYVYRDESGHIVREDEWKDYHCCVTMNDVCIKCGKYHGA